MGWISMNQNNAKQESLQKFDILHYSYLFVECSFVAELGCLCWSFLDVSGPEWIAGVWRMSGWEGQNHTCWNVAENISMVSSEGWQGSFYAANWLILANFDPNFVIPETSVNQVRKDLSCMLGGSGRLSMTACPAPVYFAPVHFSRIFARPEWYLDLSILRVRFAITNGNIKRPCRLALPCARIIWYIQARWSISTFILFSVRGIKILWRARLTLS